MASAEVEGQRLEEQTWRHANDRVNLHRMDRIYLEPGDGLHAGQSGVSALLCGAAEQAVE